MNLDPNIHVTKKQAKHDVYRKENMSISGVRRKNAVFHSKTFQGGNFRAKGAFTICRFVPSLFDDR